MANIKSAKKRVKQNEKRRIRNKALRTRMKNVTKKLLIAIDTEESPEKVQELLSSSYTVLDKAAKKGVIHKNKASRKKSRLTVRAKNYLESHK